MPRFRFVEMAQASGNYVDPYFVRGSARCSWGNAPILLFTVSVQGVTSDVKAGVGPLQ